MLLALTAETIPRHRDKIVEGGAIVYDASLDIRAEDLDGDGIQFIGLPMTAIEADDKKIRQGRDHGITLHTHHLKLTDDSLVLFKRLIDMHRVDILVAQNWLYGMAMGDDLRWDNWMLALQASDIYEIFIQDQRVTDCIAKLEALYHVAQRDNGCVYMVRNQVKAPKSKPPA